jgi:hypothetical protein
MRIPDLGIIIGQLLIYISAASALQQPLLEDVPTTPSISTSQWKFNFTSEAPHYFASLYSLLQQWPNTFFPNGHSIVPCSIPSFTRLFHGRMDGDVPPSPEWVAFDMQVPLPLSSTLT